MCLQRKESRAIAGEELLRDGIEILAGGRKENEFLAQASCESHHDPPQSLAGMLNGKDDGNAVGATARLPFSPALFPEGGEGARRPGPASPDPDLTGIAKVEVSLPGLQEKCLAK